MKLVRYCFECGHVGEVPKGKRDCCPDGNHAEYVRQEIAEQAKYGLKCQLILRRRMREGPPGLTEGQAMG